MHALREACDRDGRTVLLVTHNPRDATFADEVRFLVDGRIAELALRRPMKIEDVHDALVRLAI
jgi:ABC-type lipoprotein export system ATPase subunit